MMLNGPGALQAVTAAEGLPFCLGTGMALSLSLMNTGTLRSKSVFRGELIFDQYVGVPTISASAARIRRPMRCASSSGRMHSLSGLHFMHAMHGFMSSS